MALHMLPLSLCVNVFPMIYPPDLYGNYIQPRLHTSRVYLAPTSSEPSDICTKEREATLCSVVLIVTKSQPFQVGLGPGLLCLHLRANLDSVSLRPLLPRL